MWFREGRPIAILSAGCRRMRVENGIRVLKGRTKISCIVSLAINTPRQWQRNIFRSFRPTRRINPKCRRSPSLPVRRRVRVLVGNNRDFVERDSAVTIDRVLEIVSSIFLIAQQFHRRVSTFQEVNLPLPRKKSISPIQKIHFSYPKNPPLSFQKNKTGMNTPVRVCDECFITIKRTNFDFNI